jgi:hypothetical protein
MRVRILRGALASLIILVGSATVLWADDLSGASKLLCAPLQGSECRRDGCETDPAWEMNVPQFVEIDLDGKTITSTDSGDGKKATKIASVKRDDNLIVLQGYDNGRAFSMVITEPSGFATMGITVDDGGVVLFASCTKAKR